MANFNSAHTGAAIDAAVTKVAGVATGATANTGALADQDTITESQISNLQAYLTSAPVDSVASLTGAISSAALTAALDTFTSSLTGMVPASGGGTANFLRADGAFAAPPGASGGDAWGDPIDADPVPATASTITIATALKPLLGLHTDTITIGGTTIDGTVSGATVTLNAQTGTAYTLVLADAGKKITMANAAANVLTIPANATVAFPVGTVLGVSQILAGVTSITGATGVTVNGVSAGTGAIAAQWTGVTLTQTATNIWLAEGNIGAFA